MKCVVETSRQAIAKWCNMFENGRTDIDDAGREGRPSTATNSEIAARVNESFLANSRVAVDAIANKLDISHGNVHKLLSSILNSVKFVLNQTAGTQHIGYRTLDGNESHETYKNLFHASRSV
ncbi:hypothetical protein AVEN_150496-1 [Araneus ventricosus]|uniref:Mos1 transposase HTH domain-containing protein n=1 Tax=Araneus ventricosus TaxID=182803 RepID=A0A4Y2H6T4_ARAVE|nr:hypothetical protein AVEN_150496-1 [Araneus ventricosus]